MYLDNIHVTTKINNMNRIELYNKLNELIKVLIVEDFDNNQELEESIVDYINDNTDIDENEIDYYKVTN